MKGDFDLTKLRQDLNRILAILAIGATLLATVGIMGCDDETISSKPNSTLLDFPNAVGNRWAYYVYDSLRTEGDTVDVHIAGFTTLPNGGGQAKIWTYSYRNWTAEGGGPRVDTEYVQVIGDTIKIHRPYPPELVTLMRSWWIGRTWTSGGVYPDTTTVVADDRQINTPFGYFTDLLLIERSWLAFEVGNESSSFFFADDTGFVVKHYRTYLLPEEDSLRVNELWAALSFSPAQ